MIIEHKLETPVNTNRLSKETSPYLLQHSHNPVEWFPWGKEGFEEAKREGKLVFLSVGYSTCYWCHVMERECFTNEKIAAEMNRRFVNIKVDREERPDVDQLYMMAVQVLTRQGGWPMSVFLTPDLRPFYGGTYFPPTDVQGRPGFMTLLRAIDDAYQSRPQDIEIAANQVVEILRQLAEPMGAERAMRVDKEWVGGLVQRVVREYDSKFGGFGGAPKFPHQTMLSMLEYYVETAGEDEMGIGKMVEHTLEMMSRGGIRDQLGGAFHRYSTDEKWLVPHFEIMLYDNALLVENYLKADQGRIAADIVEFVLREMRSPEGAFYTAIDAEVDGKEGASYLWTAEEIEQVLGKEDAKIFNGVYGVEQDVLYRSQRVEDDALELQLKQMKLKLYEARSKRKQPIMDTKILTGWNALMIRGMADAGRELDKAEYVIEGARSMEYLLSKHRMPDGGVYRGSRDGEAKVAGFLDDYAFTCLALLSLWEASGEEKWKEEAKRLAEVMIEKFWDERRGGFYFTAKDVEDLIVRQKVGTDSPLPSGNAVAACVMLELGWEEKARETLRVFAGQMEANAESMSAMIETAMRYVQKVGVIEVEAAEKADRPMRPEELAEEVVTLRGEWRGKDELVVHASILNGFHINAHQAAEGLVDTQVVVAGEMGEEVAEVDYPPGEAGRVYSGEVEFVVRFRREIEEGEKVIVGVRYQACDENACLPVVMKMV